MDDPQKTVQVGAKGADAEASATGRRACSRIEALLLAEGVVTEDVLRAARQRQHGAKRPLVEILLEQEAVDEERLVSVLAEATGMKVIPPEALTPDPKVQELVPAETAQRLGILPLHVDGSSLVVATGDPFQLLAFDELSASTNLRVKPVFASPSEVRKALRRVRSGEETLDNILKHSPDEGDVLVLPEIDLEEMSDGADTVQIDSGTDDSPVIRLLNLVLASAIRQGASDIHIEPEKDRVRVRVRVDGELHEALELPENVRNRLISRLKIVSGLNTIETRLPQDGRSKVALDGRLYDLRVSTLPSYFGEKSVIRILDQNAATFSLDRSGIDEGTLVRWRNLLGRPEGLLLVTGPTGSGKSTTLYASLLELRAATTNIVAIEDPVEYQFPGIVHVPVRSEIGMTFAAALRSVLRQDPDVVLVGEIRDAETAEVAIRASMTGHLVLSTLHTNDAVGAISRLLDLGVSRKLLASCLMGVVAQRLVRTVCDECSEPFVYSPVLLSGLGADLPQDLSERTRKGKGCAKCRGTGYRGRTALVELIRVTPDLRAAISEGAEEGALAEQAVRDGTLTLFQSGVGKILAGSSTPDAVLRVAAPETTSAAASGTGASPEEAPGSSRRCESCGEEMKDHWCLCPLCGAEPPEATEGPVAVVCDDSPMTRRLVRAALAPLFARIVEVEDGKEGLDAVFRAKPELLVVDQVMPEMTGVEVIRELRSRIETASLPIVMLTASESDELESEVLEAGADDYLQKPIATERLRARVKAVLAACRRAATRAEAVAAV